MTLERGVQVDERGVRLPLAAIRRLRFVFPAAPLVHRSRGIDRTEPLPTRFYTTPSGDWGTADRDLLRLLHQDVPYLLERVAGLAADAQFVAGSTNYGSNPYYCLRHPLADPFPIPLFHLKQECLEEPHHGLAIAWREGAPVIEAVQVRFDATERAAYRLDGTPLPSDALVCTAPAIVWAGSFVGWEAYTRATYDCRHVAVLQYVDQQRYPQEFERARAEIQRLQCLWPDRDRYVAEVLRAAKAVGYAPYERLVLGVGGVGPDRYLLLASYAGTAAEVAAQLIVRYPDLEAATELAEGGSAGVLVGTPAAHRILGPSTYRRGRILCCLLCELSLSPIVKPTP